MNRIEIKEKFVQLLLRWIFIVLPTAVIGYVTLVYANLSYTAFATGIVSQTLFFTAGLTIAYALYYFRARWIFTVVLLWIAYIVINRIIVKLPGEFDVFYATARFQLFSALFLFGWLFGFLLVRIRYAFIILVAILAVATIVTTSNTIDVSLTYILWHLVPVVLYGLYMLFLSPLLTTTVEMDVYKSARLLIRFTIFLILVLVAFLFVERFLRSDLKAVEKELAARGAKDKDGKGNEGGKNDKGYDQRNGLMEKGGKDGKGDDGYRLKDTMKVNSKMSQSEVLMFCSKLDSYFPDGSPKPMYFVYHYLTRFDPIRETFTRDVNVPSFDEFDADPSAVDMYHSVEDRNVIRNLMGDKFRSVVEAKVYLSSNTWKHSLLAPAGAFYVQPIPVEKDFQKSYYAAYRVKSWASELNNAFYVYNTSANPMLEPFQKQRTEELERVENYRAVDSTFMNYYTKIPRGQFYDSIAAVTERITRGITRPVDKVMAVRDYFLQRDEFGKRVFRYTLKPGGSPDDPNIPTATMLGNFMFKTHAGYCTYYAGASLFMLRAMGIPSRFTTGFATVNRSDKNKGWYWFYASQAHAWTQVYFPGYGWIDFDMTIGNEEQHEAPRPDGTPPLPPPEPWLVLNAKVASQPDVKVKHLDATFRQLIYFDEGFELNSPATRTIDASHSRILYDKRDTTFACIAAGDSLVIVSFKDEVRPAPKPILGIAIDLQIKSFPSPIIADEIHIKVRPGQDKKKDDKKEVKAKEEKPMTWQEILLLTTKIAGSIVVLIFLLPLITLLVFILKRSLAKTATAKADATYRAALYQYHMAGAERYFETPLEYARRKIDPLFHAGFENFMTSYLRMKYSKEVPSAEDYRVVASFARTNGKAVVKAKGFFRIALNYLNLLLLSRFFLRTENPEDINQSPFL